jgi:aryl-alcohol dehydrogenase-like predicted oxidoreductase
MEHRHLGRSGLLVSAVAYGNWLTHGNQVEEEAGTACVQRALDLGITTFDTADAYAGTRAEEVLGRALAGQRREGLEIATKVFFPTGTSRNNRGLSRKHIMESINGSLRRLGTDYVDLYQAHRFDYSTPLEETMVAFSDLVRTGKALYIGVSEWTADEISAGAEIARTLRIPLVSNQPQYSMLWRGIEGKVIPACEAEGLSQIVFSPLGQGVLTGKYLPRQPIPDGSRATDGSGKEFISRFMRDDVLERVQLLRPIAQSAGLSMAGLATAWVLQNRNVASAIVGATKPDQLNDSVTGVGITLEPTLMAAIDKALDTVVDHDPDRSISPTQRP